MRYLDLTLPTAAGNLACDEALVELCENGSLADEILRAWEPQDCFVVAGYGNKIETEVNLTTCREKNIPVYRRTSGGGTVLQSPGCFNYALILDVKKRPSLRNILTTNTYVLEYHRKMLEKLMAKPVQLEGLSDLAIDGRKCSGNAQRRKRRFVLVHGTFLLGVDFGLMSKLLPLPSKEPPYRRNRSHAEFLTNLNLDSEALKTALRATWKAEETLTDVPLASIRELAKTGYAPQKSMPG